MNGVRALEPLLEPQERLDRLIAATSRRFGRRVVDLSYANPYDRPDEEVLRALELAIRDDRALAFQYTPYGTFPRRQAGFSGTRLRDFFRAMSESTRLALPSRTNSVRTMAFTVLLADDDQRLRGELTRLLISRRCVSVVEARDGEEALRLALALRPDVVLMDIVMPHMDGLEATRRIKAEQPETKIILLTVFDEAQYRTAARDSGADSYLLKKRLGAELIPAIGRLVPEFSTADPEPQANGRTGGLFVR